MLRKVFAAALFALSFASPALASTCYIREYSELGTANSGVAGEPAIRTQSVTFTSSPGNSAAFLSNTRFIRVWCDAQASYDIGLAASAVNTMAPITASLPEYFGVKGGHRASFVANP